MPYCPCNSCPRGAEASRRSTAASPLTWKRAKAVDATGTATCEAASLGSRLDEYGEDHVVFKLTAHNEDVHQRAADEKKRRRSEAAFRQQPTRNIGDFSYILEDHIGDQYCWRCKYVQCKGKCRTDIDGRLVFGPTKHTCIQLADESEVSSRRGQPLSSEHTPASPEKSVADTSTDANAHQRQQHVGNADNSNDSYSSQGRKSEPGQPPRKKVTKNDSSESDDDDEDDEWKFPRSRSRGGGNSNTMAIRSIASAARVLETMSRSCSCTQNKLLAAVYERAHGLLLKEENLLEVQMRNELQIDRLLNGQLKG
ncbi:hypothetical protein MTO96_024991 [Rhipicephalus appendiculatus]